jgi:hypothetical protein
MAKDLKPIGPTLKQLLKPKPGSSLRRRLKILRVIAQSQGNTMNSIAEAIDDKPQNIHPILVRMIKQGVLGRIQVEAGIDTRGQKFNEYRYYLLPNIRIADIESLWDEIENPSGEQLPLQDPQKINVQIEPPNDMEQSIEEEMHVKDVTKELLMTLVGEFKAMKLRITELESKLEAQTQASQGDSDLERLLNDLKRGGKA